mmetsp:Transcript_1490/g.3226  ORF Transcript_1490/g.3226 Transcript_1490/m.3226 type:complete len:110 (-) Transcript_1490:1016-1345(-)
MDLEYLTNWDLTKRDAAKKNHVKIMDDSSRKEKKTKKKMAPSVLKITRNDLGYMMDWDQCANLEKKGGRAIRAETTVAEPRGLPCNDRLHREIWAITTCRSSQRPRRVP